MRVLTGRDLSISVLFTLKKSIDMLYAPETEAYQTRESLSSNLSAKDQSIGRKVRVDRSKNGSRRIRVQNHHRMMNECQRGLRG